MHFAFTVFSQFMKQVLTSKQLWNLTLKAVAWSEMLIKKWSLLNCMPCMLKMCSCTNLPSAYVPTCPVCSHANMLCVFTCSCVLRGHMAMHLACLRANVLVLIPLFSVSLLLLLKLYTLLLRFKSLITVFPQ